MNNKEGIRVIQASKSMIHQGNDVYKYNDVSSTNKSHPNGAHILSKTAGKHIFAARIFP